MRVAPLLLALLGCLPTAVAQPAFYATPSALAWTDGAPTDTLPPPPAAPSSEAPSQRWRGLTLSGAVLNDAFGVVPDGASPGATMLFNLDLQATLDTDALLGWRGGTAFLYALATTGTGSPSQHAGDAQVASNIDAPRGLRLYEAWLEQRAGAASVRAGLYDLNSEFYVTETAGLFLNSAHGIGPEFAASGGNGPSIFPITSLAARVHYATGSGYLQAAVLDGVPGAPNRPATTGIALSRADGALIVAEAGLRSGDERPTFRLAGGTWRYTALTESVDPGAPPRGNRGAYLVLEGRLAAEADATQGVWAFARGGVADARVSAAPASWGAGLVYIGLLPGRDADEAGVAVAALHTTSLWRAQARQAGTPLAPVELAVEVSYRCAVTPWLTLQPDLQYIIHPGFDRRAHPALLLGTRAELTF